MIELKSSFLSNGDICHPALPLYTNKNPRWDHEKTRENPRWMFLIKLLKKRDYDIINRFLIISS